MFDQTKQRKDDDELRSIQRKGKRDQIWHFFLFILATKCGLGWCTCMCLISIGTSHGPADLTPMKLQILTYQWFGQGEVAITSSSPTQSMLNLCGGTNGVVLWHTQKSKFTALGANLRISFSDHFITHNFWTFNIRGNT